MMSSTSALSSALNNATSVMGHTDTQYLSRQFEIVSDVEQRASFEDLTTDLQAIFHRCKREPKSLESAKRILITLGIIAGKQCSPKDRALFSKMHAVVMQTLSDEAQIGTVASRAAYFQDKLTLLLYARKTMITQALEAQTGLTYINSIEECSEAFDNVTTSGSEGRASLAYKATDDLSTLAVSVLFRIQSLCEIEGNRTRRLLTRAEIQELDDYCRHEDPQVRKIANDFALLRKRIAANSLFSHAGLRAEELMRIGHENALLEPSFPRLLSPYYPAYEKFVRFEQQQAERPNVGMTQEQTFAIRYKERLDIYDEHLTQLPALNFAYRYFYNELNELYLLSPKRTTFISLYKKAYDGRPLPTPDEFYSILAEFPKPISLSILREEHEEKEQKEELDCLRVQRREKKEKKKAESKQSSCNANHQRAKSKQEPSESKRTHSPDKVVVVAPKAVKLKELDDATESTRVPIVEAELPVTVQAKTTPPLLKVIIKREPLPFEAIVYDPRVSLWFTEPEECLALPQYAPLEATERVVAIWKHAFPDALDHLVGTDYSLPEPWQNRTRRQLDLLYSIPGEVEFIGSSKRIRGLFQYCFGSKDNVCYHRCFKEMGMRDLIRHDQYAKAFNEVDFPPLSTLTSPPVRVKPKPDQILVYEPHLNTYAVSDKNLGITFRAFKIRDLD